MADPTPSCLVELFKEPWNGVVVPIVQRDYAQGRPGASEIRARFIEALRDALVGASHGGAPLDLDFVYGYDDNNGSNKRFVPIDGQQRLTTLFLLHWYLAHRDGQLDHFRSWACDGGRARFRYAVRPSSEDFLEGLALSELDLDALLPAEAGLQNALSRTVRNEHWYYLTWELDPTVRSCLSMLDAIHQVFGETQGLYAQLIGPEPAITFRFLDLQRFGLGDELYIKMNARGRALTDFEVFKSEVEKLARTHAELRDEQVEQGLALSQHLGIQFDTTWSHLLWALLRAEHDPDTDGTAWTRKLDDQLLNVLRVLAIVLHPLAGEEEEGSVAKALEDLHNGVVTTFPAYDERGAVHAEWVRGVIALMDGWAGGTPEHPALQTFMERAAYYDESEMFRQVREDRRRLPGRRTKPQGSLSYTDVVRFAAYCTYLRAGHDLGGLDDWMRVLGNLAVNSTIERGEELRRALVGLRRLCAESGGEVLTYLATGGKVDGFLGQQIREERLKAQLLLEHPDWRPLIERAELHVYFRGQIEFLLDFSGVMQAWLESGSEVSDAVAGETAREAFELALRRAEQVFSHPSGGLGEHAGFRVERALLCFGDYTLRTSKTGWGRSLGVNAPDKPASWKALLRADTRNDELRRKRKLLRAVFDEIDPDDLDGSLDAVIDAGIRSEEDDDADWRQILIEHPKMLAYCRRRCLLRDWYRDDETGEWVAYRMLLVAKLARGPWQEPHTWLAADALQKRHDKGKLRPFREVRLEHGSGAAVPPRVVLFLPRHHKPSYQIVHELDELVVSELKRGKASELFRCSPHKLVKKIRKLGKQHGGP